MNRVLLCGLVVGTLALAVGSSVADDYIYWTAATYGSPGSVVRRAKTDGTSVETVASITGSSIQIVGLAVDSANGNLYYAVNTGSSSSSHIVRANLDGSNAVNLINDVAQNIALDLVHGKIYWDKNPPHSDIARLRRANLDGSNVETIASTSGAGNAIVGVAVDPVGGKVYYSTEDWPGPYYIRSCNLDGTGNAVFYNADPAGDYWDQLVVDPVGGKLYWNEHLNLYWNIPANRIRRVNLNGSGGSETVHSFTNPSDMRPGLCLDAVRRYIYFATTNASPGNDIWRINDDGTGLTNVLSCGDSIYFLALALNVPGPNHDPIANAGADQTVTTGPQATVTVTLDGTASTDPDGDPLEYVWTVPAGSGITLGNANSAIATATIPANQSGEYSILLTVTDGKGGTSTDEVVVNVVVDSTPPDITCFTDRISLWPPDHRIVEVTLFVSISDGEVTAQCKSSEPDDATGDGAFAGDVNGGDGFTAPQPIALSYNATLGCYVGTLRLRAERDGSETGRTYTIVCTATDAYGNSKTARCAVVVPHDRRRQ